MMRNTFILRVSGYGQHRWESSAKYTHVGCVSFLALLLIWTEVPRKPQSLKTLGETIRHHRQCVGMSQETLAERANLHPVYVGKIERGEQWISLHALLRVAKAIGVRPGQLVERL